MSKQRMKGWALAAAGAIVVVGLPALPALEMRGHAQVQGGGDRCAGPPRYSLSDPVPQDPALHGAIDMHAHQNPDSCGDSYGQAGRSDDAIDLYQRAKAAGMRGFVIKQHLDQTADLAYYMRRLYPDMEIFGGMGSNLTTGPAVNPWAITHMAEVKGGWGRIVWMPSWDSEHSSHEVRNWHQPAFVSVARCAGGGFFWANYPTPCADAELLPEVKEAIRVIATTKTRDSNGDLILATGHNSPQEGMMMIKEAVRVGVKHIIITHPLLGASGPYTDEEITQAVRLGPEIYAEFTSQFGREGADELLARYVRGIRAAGVEHAFVSSDTGQMNSKFQPDALADAAKALRGQGFTEHELDLLFKINPAKILGLTPATTSQ